VREEGEREGERQGERGGRKKEKRERKRDRRGQNQNNGENKESQLIVKNKNKARNKDVYNTNLRDSSSLRPVFT
jgi:hypothetical protein